ncbi:MAG: hypothetical protein RIS88_101 [Pseudomonadota bacterium]|jgi:hypothetical protein
MKQFDPSVGWISNSGQPARPDSDAGTPLPHATSVVHLNRQDHPSHASRLEEGRAAAPASALPDDGPALPAVLRTRDTAPPESFLRAPAETAGMVRELFERLDEADPSQALLARVSDNLKTLDDLTTKKRQLERVLADITQEMAHLQVQVRADLDAARDSEDRNLKLRQYRREILEQLARRLPEAGKP